MSLSNLSSSLYKNSYVSLFNKNQSVKNTENNHQESNKTNNTQKEEIEKKIADMLERGFEDEEIALYANKQIPFVLMEQNGDSLEQFQKFTEKIKALKNISLPAENEFEVALDNLTKEIHSILTNFYEKEPDSEEFKNLLGFALTITSEVKERQSNKQQLLSVLNQAQQDSDFAKSLDFVDKLFTPTSHTNKQGHLASYTTNNTRLAQSLDNFFRLAEAFGTTLESSRARIQDSLQITQRYLYNQGGNIDNSFKVGDFVISFEGDPLFDDMESFPLSITYQKSNDILASLSSNFDSSQTFFEVLEQRDKLEKENQELKTKQAYNAYGISKNTLIQTDSSSDSILQTLLKESKESEA